MTAIERIADEHLDRTAYYHWAGLAQAIREQHADSRSTGEVVARVEIDETQYEISESFFWADRPDGDIVHALHVHHLGGSGAAHRQRLIRRPA